MVTRRRRRTGRRPSEAAAIPLPSDETTPPVTKIYFVELTGSPPSGAGSTAPPRIADCPPCPPRERPGRQATLRRSAGRAARAAAAPAAPIAPRAPAVAAPTARAPHACTHRRPRAGDTGPTPCPRGRTGSG